MGGMKDIGEPQTLAESKAVKAGHGRAEKTPGWAPHLSETFVRFTSVPSPPGMEGAGNLVEADFHQTDVEMLLDKMQTFKIQGRDKGGRKILRIVGKFFPARAVDTEALRKYLEERIFPALGEGRFCIVYVHTRVQRGDNFPGISTLRSIYEALPPAVKDNLEAVYFVHPGLQSRLFFATFGRLLFSAGLYGKLRYVNRLEFLWEHIRKWEVEMPEFVYDHDEELEFRPLMDYGLESDHHRPYDAPAMDSAVSIFDWVLSSELNCFGLDPPVAFGLELVLEATERRGNQKTTLLRHEGDIGDDASMFHYFRSHVRLSWVGFARLTQSNASPIYEKFEMSLAEKRMSVRTELGRTDTVILYEPSFDLFKGSKRCYYFHNTLEPPYPCEVNRIHHTDRSRHPECELDHFRKKSGEVVQKQVPIYTVLSFSFAP
ncbi:hypothetical protein H6P81_017459 [Aristolochia fimbriata]|uniref:CRAL-TRIO domain-containing protein n=1 Tax=Aristolochia fimbriata TaxID=158543 RepID=A0AAV7DY70_ARIFI|nr:hypothetical protein H6P81_017459 [Aristolochia fimbriata]